MKRVVAEVTEPCCGVVWGNGFEGLGDGLIERFSGSCFGVTKKLLELGPGLFDGV